MESYRMIDYHNHTKLCKHAEGEVFQYIEKAISLGITEMAFTDHMPLPDNFDIAHRMQENEMEIYSEWINKARERYPEIKILFGIEADYYEGFETYIENFLKRYDFDLVIMSVHFLKKWYPESWVFNYNFPNRSYSDIYTEYLQTLLKGIKTGLFDIVGHLDVVKKSNFSMIEFVPEELENVMREINKQNMVLEINTSGLRKKIAEPYPALDMFDIIKKNEVPICIGSDAHKPEQVGFKFEEIYGALLKKNFKYLTLFEKRKQRIKSIEEIFTVKYKNPIYG